VIKYAVYIYATAVLLLVSSFVKSENVRFHKLTVNDGLPYNSIRAITQDALGYLWFGTELGLARYDGESLTTYYADKTAKNTLADSYVRSLEIDINGTLWVGGGSNGLSKYNRATNNFTVYQHDPNSDNSLSSNTIRSIESDSHGNLWIATDNGLNFFRTSNKTVVRYFKQSDSGISLPSNNLNVVLTSKAGKLYIGSDKGLTHFDPDTQTFRQISLSETAQPSVRTIVENSSSDLWIGTNNGLYHFHPDSKKVRKINFIQDVQSVLSALIDKNDELWIGTFEYGIFHLDKHNNLTNFRPDNSRSTSLADKSILSLFQDFSGVIIAGTYNSGVNYFEPLHSNFGSYDNSNQSIKCLPSSDVREAFAINNDEMFLGTIEGLSIVKLSDKSCINFTTTTLMQNKISDNEVFAIIQETEDTYWVGTGAGLERFDRKLNRFTLFQDADKQAVYNIKDYDDQLLLAVDRGLLQFNKKDQSFSTVKTVDEQEYQGAVFSIKTDFNNRLWFATTDGLFFFDESLNRLIKYDFDDSLFSQAILRTLEITADGMLWFTIEGLGLVRLEPISRKVTLMNEKLGITLREGFSGLYKDSDENLWLTSLSSGLFQILPDKDSAFNYHLVNGINSESFNFNSSTVFPDGRVLFGGKSGFNLFNPKEIKLNQSSPKVIIDNFTKFGTAQNFFSKNNVLQFEEDNSVLDLIELTYQDSLFGFDIVPIHLPSQNKMRLAYKLEGLDSDWNYSSSRNRRVTYNNVKAGNYIFRFKAQSVNGIWSDNEVAVRINKSQAPWLTWWAMSSYIVFIILSIYIFITKRTQYLESQALKLQNTVEKRTSELIKEKQKVEQLLSRKNEEFANVSHEFRTPLTLILGPLAQVLKSNKNSEEINRLNIVQRNGYRLLRMVDQLLNMETFRVKSITQKSPQAIGKTVQLLAEAFADLAKEKNITLTLKRTLDVNFSFTPDAFEKILLNLLSNAIKYTKSGGAIEVDCERTKDNELMLEVSDTGIGIPNDKLDSVFERYSRVLDENSEQVTGAGIGLALVKELVTAHQGRIEVDSELGQGTCIRIYLPIVDEVSEQAVKQHSNDEIIAMEIMGLTSQKIEAVAASASASASATESDTSGKPCVLVIEDNPDMREYIANSISDDYQVMTANNGKQGLQVAIEQVPDLIISDIMMPEMDGYQTAHALRHNEVTNHIPIILLTARGDRESRLKGWYERADEYLTKPFDVEELKIRLQNLLDIRNILKKRFAENAFEARVVTIDNLQSEITTETSAEIESDIETNQNRLQQAFVDKLNHILEQYYTNASTSIQDITSQLAMSERQFFRKMKNVLDMTPSEYLRRFRLEKARQLLNQGKKTSFVTYEVGFNSQSYFGKCFKAQYGMSPSEFQKSLN
jgi:signal transduction histidine kinase/ligand-binding sensor domain-containing protein/DNA-binding response OmpR family regulator